MSVSESSSESDLHEFPCRKDYAFHYKTQQPVVYFFQNPRGRWENKNKGHNNYFEKAFKWYTKERHGSEKPSNPDLPGFVTWLDSKYEEYEKTKGDEQLRRTKSSQYFETVLEPKDISSGVASVCHYQARTSPPEDKIPETSLNNNMNKTHSAPQIPPNNRTSDESDYRKPYTALQPFNHADKYNSKPSFGTSSSNKMQCECPMSCDKSEDERSQANQTCNKMSNLERIILSAGPYGPGGYRQTVQMDLMNTSKNISVQTSSDSKSTCNDSRDATGQTSNRSMLLIKDTSHKCPILLKVIYANKTGKQ